MNDERRPAKAAPDSISKAEVTSSPLSLVIAQAAAETGRPLKDLTVLATQNDPFRIDTPARHRDGEWLAITAGQLGLGSRRIHLRGLHYMVLGRPKPDGRPYANTDDDWTWLSEHAGKAARWLGYLPFDQVVDQRNSPPVVRTFQPPEPEPYISVGVDVEIPDVDDIEPRVDAWDFRGVQPYKLVIFGEKSSLADVLGPIAEAYAADLYLPTGEISDTLLYQMASVGAADGRPMVVLCFSDADPAGWQMPVSIARKLQAFKALGETKVAGQDGYGNRISRTVDFAALEFEVHRVALTPEQVREHGLPSTPLKATERRADNWKAAMGVEQTEIDALASLRPDLLRRIARDAIAPFYDLTLERRVRQARDAWQAEAQAIVDANLDPERLAQLRTDAAEKLASMRAEIDAINNALRVDADDFDLPEIVVPEAELAGGGNGLPLLDSRWSFAEQSSRLIDSKAYRP